MTDDSALAPDLAEIERKATEWAAECGRQAAEFFRQGIAVEYKSEGRRNPVTEADRQIEDFLREAIAHDFPGHCVLGEERPDLGSSAADFVWVLDPVDGTANFAAGLPLFAVSIGVLHKLSPVVGAIYVPSSTRLEGGVLHARRGGGCFLGERRLKVFAEQGLHPSRPVSVPAAFRARFAIGKGMRNKKIETRNIGSIAYELALIAGGGLQLGIFRSPHIWDVAGGAVLVAEAGGLVLWWDEQEEVWQPMAKFTPSKGRRGEEGRLRDWEAPLLAGGTAPTAVVAQHIRPSTGGILARLRRWIKKR